MKKIVVLFAAIMMLGGIGFSAQKATTYNGEIMDSFCAPMGNHGGKPSKDCTLTCVKDGATFVLYNPADKSTYQLDDQKKPQQFSGQKVKVTGTLDKATKTIHVTDIQAGA